MTSFYLASKSPRRKELLTHWGYDFDVLLSSSEDSVNESVLPNETPEDYVKRIASEKAFWGTQELTKADLKPLPVLASDTTVALGGRIFGKPANFEEAYEFLSAFSGHTHEVLTAVAVAAPKKRMLALSRSLVTFRVLTDEEIRAYIRTGDPMDKAGGYGIQGKAGAFVSNINGSYSGIMGLPQAETVQLLCSFGIPYF